MLIPNSFIALTELFSNRVAANAVGAAAIGAAAVENNNFLFYNDETAVDRILMRHSLFATTAREHAGAESNSE